MFEKAIELDPKYAAAYVSLGYTLRFQWNWLWNEDPDPLNHALRLAKQAIALDESLASAHGLLRASICRKRNLTRRSVKRNAPSRWTRTPLIATTCSLTF